MPALSGSREMTTAETGARLPEVPRVTLYRQVALLVDGGFLEVIGEERVRGAVERRYRLRQDRPTVDADAAAGMSIEGHRRGFAAAIAVLIAEFNGGAAREERSRGCALDGEDVTWGAAERVAEPGQCREANSLRAIVLENRQVDHTEPNAVGKLRQAHTTLAEEGVNVADDARFLCRH